MRAKLAGSSPAVMAATMSGWARVPMPVRMASHSEASRWVQHLVEHHAVRIVSEVARRGGDHFVVATGLLVDDPFDVALDRQPQAQDQREVHHPGSHIMSAQLLGERSHCPRAISSSRTTLNFTARHAGYVSATNK